MKSRKLKAVLAAVSALAVLATAMTGFAATITTETTYNIDDPNKATVKTSVKELTDATAEVTLLVKAPGAGVNGSGIAYIDQKTASDGQAIFEYQLDKTALSDAKAATVVTGNDSAESSDKIADSTLNVQTIDDVDETKYTIDYDYQVYGNNDEKLVATIKAKTGYVLKSVSIGGTEQDVIKETYDVPINNGVAAEVAVEAAEEEKSPNLSGLAIYEATSDGVVSTTTVMKVEGNPTEVGVAYGAYTYEAKRTNDDNGYVAVTLKAKADNNIDKSKIKAYYVVDNNTTEVTINN